MQSTPDQILDFWFSEAGPDKWYANDPKFDVEVRDRFLATFESAAAGECAAWREDAPGRLAEIIVLDQFPRNIYRDTPLAFASDPVALVLAQEAVRLGHHQALGERKSCLLMPYMHSESRLIHAEAETLFAGTPSFDYELRHKAIIDRFGRYPHRNAILGRTSTAEELAFLEEPGSSF